MAEFNFDDFLKFIKDENNQLNTRLGHKVPYEENVFATLSKLMEESGELASEIFINLKRVRKEKIYENSKELAAELADTIIVLGLLADTLGVDIKQALSDKIEKIKKRNLSE